MAEFTDEEAKKLVDTFKTLGVKPKTDDKVALEQWMLDYLKSQGQVPPVAVPVPDNQPRHVTHTFPKLAVFSGESSKGSVSYDLWHYDVRCLVQENLHPPEGIKQAIRNSLRGEAGRIVNRLGPGATIDAILAKLDGVYGTVELGENLLSEFYSARQKQSEDVSKWSCRIEDLLAKAQERGQVRPDAVNEMLRTKFWTGLNQKLKDSSRHKFDSIQDFDQLRVAIRAIEHEYRLTEEQEAPKAQAKMSQATPDMTKVLKDISDQLKKLRSDVDDLKKNRNSPVSSDRPASVQASNSQSWSSENRSRPECYRCHRRNHLQRDCRAKFDVNGRPLNE